MRTVERRCTHYLHPLHLHTIWLISFTFCLFLIHKVNERELETSSVSYNRGVHATLCCPIFFVISFICTFGACELERRCTGKKLQRTVSLSLHLWCTTLAPLHFYTVGCASKMHKSGIECIRCIRLCYMVHLLMCIFISPPAVTKKRYGVCFACQAV